VVTKQGAQSRWTTVGAAAAPEIWAVRANVSRSRSPSVAAYLLNGVPVVLSQGPTGPARLASEAIPVYSHRSASRDASS